MRENGKIELNEAMEQLSASIRESNRAVLEGASVAGEHGLRFAWSLFAPYLTGPAASEIFEANRRVARTLVEQSERQREALRTIAAESARGYVDLVYAPLDYFVPHGGSGEGLPLEDYDRLSVSEVSRNLDRLSPDEIRHLRSYEKRNKNRDTLIGELDRRLQTVS